MHEPLQPALTNTGRAIAWELKKGVPTRLQLQQSQTEKQAAEFAAVKKNGMLHHSY